MRPMAQLLSPDHLAYRPSPISENGKSAMGLARSAESDSQRSCFKPSPACTLIIMPCCSLAPVLDSHSFSTSLVYWPHRSALLQTSAVATSHRVDAVRDALGHGGLDVALASQPAGHSTPGLHLSGAR